MLVIRLRRMGSKKRPYFRLIVTEARTPRDSRALEVIGQYDPRARPAVVKVDRERLDYWVKAGARPSDTVRTLVAGLPAEAPATPAEPAAAPELASPGEGATA